MSKLLYKANVSVNHQRHQHREACWYQRRPQFVYSWRPWGVNAFEEKKTAVPSSDVGPCRPDIAPPLRRALAVHETFSTGFKLSNVFLMCIVKLLSNMNEIPGKGENNQRDVSQGLCSIYTKRTCVHIESQKVIKYHYCDVIMCAIASQITSLTSVYSTVNSFADQRKHQSSASLAFVRGIHRWPVNSPYKGPFGCRNWTNQGEMGRRHGCWCLGSLYHQDINSHSIDYIR